VRFWTTPKTPDPGGDDGTTEQRLPARHKTARLALAVRPKPYFRGVGVGKSLGYIRRASGPGAWIVREWESRASTRPGIVGVAETSDSGRPRRARLQARPRDRHGQRAPVPRHEGLTVKDAVESYLTALGVPQQPRRRGPAARRQHIIPTLGKHRVDRLTKRQIEEWLGGLVQRRTPRRTPDARRRYPGFRQSHPDHPQAALNHAFADDANNIATEIGMAPASRRPQGVAGARADHFDATQIRKLITEAAKLRQVSFANLCEAAT